MRGSCYADKGFGALHQQAFRESVYTLPLLASLRKCKERGDKDMTKKEIYKEIRTYWSDLYKEKPITIEKAIWRIKESDKIYNALLVMALEGWSE